MRQGRLAALAVLIIGGGAAEVCGSPAAAQDPPVAQWNAGHHVRQVVDLTPPRSDGWMVVAAEGRLSLMAPGHPLEQFADGRRGYKTAKGPEAYIALSPGQAVPGAKCRFGAGDVAAIDPQASEVILVKRSGRARRLARIPAAGLPDGITFDQVGRFRHRLLVTRVNRGITTLFAVDCRGRVTALTSHAPVMEGGIVVAPATFGAFAGALIAPDENSGLIYGVWPDGHANVIVNPGLPYGQDKGMESTGFVPPAFGPGWSAYVADRAGQPAPHPGDDVILTLDAAALSAAGVAPGDLLVAAEGGGATVAIRCAATCSAVHIADGPPTAHVEGHIVFARAG
jgi:hypothetical protein